MTTPTDSTPTRPASQGRRTLVRIGVAVALLATGGGGLYLALTTTDDARIRRVVGDFASAVDRQDDPAMLDLLCAEEAAAITEDDDYDPPAAPAAAADEPEREITDVRITPAEQTASARVTSAGREPVTIHLRYEGDRWKVCAPAGS